MSGDKMGIPAYPVVTANHVHSTGAWIWDYYAAAALAGVSADPEFTADRARWAAEQADAMLAERAKRMEGNE